MEIPEYKTLPKYDYLWTFLGLFIPCPMSQCKYTPDFVIGDYGFGATIGINKIPIGLIIILLAILF